MSATAPKPIQLPFKVCRTVIIHECEKCKDHIELPDREPREYKCPTCGTPFRTEIMPDGTLGVILTPIDPHPEL